MATQSTTPLLKVEGLKQYFRVNKNFTVKAVDDVSFEIYPGETYGLVGESGSGKSTIGRSIIRLYDPTAGKITFDGQDISGRLTHAQNNTLRTQMQMIFQDPYASLNPKIKIGNAIAEPMLLHGQASSYAEAKEKIQHLLEVVGLQPAVFDRYPHEFSGGQRQRIGISRALATKPKFVVCDEAVSALDVSIQAQIINLLNELQDKYKLTYLFISHDLSVVEHISDTVGVMYLGNLVEYGAKEDIFRNPLHPYTKALFSAIPIPDPKVKMNRIVLEGSIPSPANPPKGCKFHTRCANCMACCKEEAPVQREIEPGHFVCCHLYDK